MNISKRISVLKCALLALALYAPFNGAWAQYELVNEGSSLNFVSIKNNIVAETHSFSSLVGFISPDGKVQVGIDLDSVETLIDIRNERMREMLFETAKFPAANVTAQIDTATLQSAAEGAVVSTEVELTVSLHGLEQRVKALLVASGGDNGSLRVFSPKPIVINASGFGLEAGVEALRDIAGLKSISYAVPVTVHLVFSPTG